MWPDMAKKNKKTFSNAQSLKQSETLNAELQTRFVFDDVPNAYKRKLRYGRNLIKKKTERKKNNNRSSRLKTIHPQHMSGSQHMLGFAVKNERTLWDVLVACGAGIVYSLDVSPVPRLGQIVKIVTGRLVLARASSHTASIATLCTKVLIICCCIKFHFPIIFSSSFIFHIFFCPLELLSKSSL
jgi:hypothetical protein